MLFSKIQPWSKQKLLKKGKIPSINDIIIIANELELRTKALFILAYLSAGRIQELVRDKNKKLPSIKKKDLIVIDKKNRKIMLIGIRNEKNKNKTNKEIPIPLDREENIRFWNLLIEYLNQLELDDELFPFNYQRAYKLLIETGFNPHWLRHIRLTHCVTIYDFNEMELMQIAGWSDPRPAKHYIELRWSDLLNKL